MKTSLFRNLIKTILRLRYQKFQFSPEWPYVQPTSVTIVWIMYKATSLYIELYCVVFLLNSPKVFNCVPIFTSALWHNVSFCDNVVLENVSIAFILRRRECNLSFRHYFLFSNEIDSWKASFVWKCTRGPQIERIFQFQSKKVGAARRTAEKMDAGFIRRKFGLNIFGLLQYLSLPSPQPITSPPPPPQKNCNELRNWVIAFWMNVLTGLNNHFFIMVPLTRYDCIN